jgi:glycosyltransferase involved in cell wall biosynthesis
MKALMLHSENSGVGYYRIWQQAKYLRRMGWDIPELPDENPRLPNDDEIGKSTVDPVLVENFKKYGSWESLCMGSDVIVYQRPDDPQTLAMALAMRDVADAPLIFEIDDNVFDVSENSPSYKYWYDGSPYRELAEMFMQNVDAITTTTQELADLYSKYNKNVYVLPNCQDPEDWEGVEKKGNVDQIVIGWAGSNTHYDDLYLIRRAVKKILRNYPNVIFRVIGTLPDFLADVPGVDLRTDIAKIRDWPSKLAELNFDIGLAPVTDRPFNQCKSNIKWQEYAMLGIPTLASRVGEYKKIEHDETGFLAYTEDEWYYYLKRLVDEADTRKRLGDNAKQYVMTERNIQKKIGQWDGVYREVADKFKSKLS